MSIKRAVLIQQGKRVADTLAKGKVVRGVGYISPGGYMKTAKGWVKVSRVHTQQTTLKEHFAEKKAEKLPAKIAGVDTSKPVVAELEDGRVIRGKVVGYADDHFTISTGEWKTKVYKTKVKQAHTEPHVIKFKGEKAWASLPQGSGKGYTPVEVQKVEGDTAYVKHISYGVIKIPIDKLDREWQDKIETIRGGK